MNKGLYGKYIITKANGEPTDTNAQYFVLRLDTDKHARVAIDAYAESLMKEFRESPTLLKGNAKLSIDIHNWLFRITSQMLDKGEK
ncbi:MAG: hypothetical protein E3J66_01560 [Dehalococcoidia bacterium]|nr:MAG: hypothetical protein E3J66_01560 [Dehalococcoidia bacterium]